MANHSQNRRHRRDMNRAELASPMERLDDFIQKRIAARKRDSAFHIQRSQNDFRSIEMLLDCKTEEAWHCRLVEREASPSMRVVRKRLHLDKFETLQQWLVRGQELSQKLVLLFRRKNVTSEDLAALFALGEDGYAFDLIAVMILFLRECGDFPCREDMHDFLTIASLRDASTLFRLLLSTLKALAPLGASTATPDVKGDDSQVAVLVAQIGDLRSALECAQIQIRACEEEIDLLQTGAVDRTWIDVLTQMNSPAMGMLLDQFAAAEQNLRRLRADGFEIPHELESVPACVRMFMRAIRALGAEPIRTPGEELIVNLEESESYDYSGSDFQTAEERKTVQVLTPGWRYKENVISLPRVAER